MERFTELKILWAHARMLGYKYAAIDRDGSCYGYKEKPVCLQNDLFNIWTITNGKSVKSRSKRLGVFTGEFEWAETLNE